MANFVRIMMAMIFTINATVIIHIISVWDGCVIITAAGRIARWMIVSMFVG